MPQRKLPPRIYLVDDDEAVAHALKFALELEGFEVQTFASGEAILAIKSYAGNGCLVLDYNLPGKDGLEILSALRSLGNGLPAILITSYPSLALRRRAKAAGAIIVKKPLLSDELVRTLKSVLAI